MRQGALRLAESALTRRVHAAWGQQRSAVLATGEFMQTALSKHAEGCAQANRRFLPIIITTLGGIGMSDFWDWWDTIWSEAIRAHADKGAPAHEAAEGKRRAIASDG